jgi:hypothetical protein
LNPIAKRALRHVVLAVALALSACGAQRKQEAAPAAKPSPEPATATAPQAAPIRGGSVTPRFDWPDGLRARIRTTQVKSQAIGTQSRLEDMVSSYTMNVRHGAEEITVAFEDFAVEHPDQEEANPTVEKVLAYRPGFTVDKEGQLAKVVGLETLRDLLGPFQDYVAALPEDQRAGLQVVAQTVASEPYLKARAAAEWSNMIGAWLGQTLTPGETKTEVAESEPTGFVEKPLRTEIKLSVSHIGTCHRGQERQCVRLWMSREPEEGALREAMLPNLDKILGVEDWGPAGPPKLRSVLATSKLIVDAEPDTLVPHRVETLRIFSIQMERPEGVIEVRDSNRATSTYQYD